MIAVRDNEYSHYNELFDMKGYVKIPNLVDKDTINIVSKYFEYSINNPIRSTLSSVFAAELEDRRYWSDRLDNLATVSRYGDPLVEVLLDEFKPVFEKITGKRLLSTYSFSRVYMSGDALPAHVDRPACEYSATVSVAYKNINDWPISMQSRGGGVASYSLQPGDAVLYKGCEVRHWRERLDIPDAVTVQFMLHYVDADGVNNKYKYDNRGSIGSYDFM